MPTSGLSARQQDVLAVARDLLTREGLEALTLGRVAQALGIKPPSLYKHFASKRHLEAALIAEGLHAFAEALEAAGPTLADIAVAYRRYALDHPHLYRLMTERPLPRDLLATPTSPAPHGPSPTGWSSSNWCDASHQTPTSTARGPRPSTPSPLPPGELPPAARQWSWTTASSATQASGSPPSPSAP